MKTQRTIGVTLFLLGLALELIFNLFASDPQVQAWYTKYRTQILGAGIVLVLLGIVLTISSIRSGAPRTATRPRIGRSRQSGLSDSVHPDEDEKSLHRQLEQHRQNLNTLLEQEAIYEKGGEPLRLLNQIEAEKQAITEIERKLQR